VQDDIEQQVMNLQPTVVVNEVIIRAYQNTENLSITGQVDTHRRRTRGPNWLLGSGWPRALDELEALNRR
jgi:hypothetical protein